MPLMAAPVTDPGRPRGLAAWRRRHPALTVAGVFVLAVTGIWAVKLVRIAHSVESYRTYWAEPQGEPGGLVYVALGDSAAQAIGASRPERGYVGLLAERMREQSGQPVQVINLSSSGATIRDLLEEQLPRLLALRPDVKLAYWLVGCSIGFHIGGITTGWIAPYPVS